MRAACSSSVLPKRIIYLLDQLGFDHFESVPLARKELISTKSNEAVPATPPLLVNVPVGRATTIIMWLIKINRLSLFVL